MEKKSLVRLIIEIDQDLKKQFCLKCLNSDKTQKDILTLLVKKWLEACD